MKRFSGWLLTVTGIIVFCFFARYNGSRISSPELLCTLAAGCIIAGGALIMAVPAARQKKEQKEDVNIRDLKENGNRVRVDLMECDIIGNNYTEDRYQHFRETATNAEILIAGRLDSETDAPVDIEILQSRVVYKTEYRGKSRTFYSPLIAKEKDSILLKCSIQKITYIYVDRMNPEIYYFDFGFMDN